MLGKPVYSLQKHSSQRKVGRETRNPNGEGERI
jgi:hypothetical protein